MFVSIQSPRLTSNHTKVSFSMIQSSNQNTSSRRTARAKQPANKQTQRKRVARRSRYEVAIDKLIAHLLKEQSHEPRSSR
jgi:hypothetical protein